LNRPARLKTKLNNSLFLVVQKPKLKTQKSRLNQLSSGFFLKHRVQSEQACSLWFNRLVSTNGNTNG